MFKSIYCNVNDLFINTIPSFIILEYKNTKLFEM